MKNTPLRSVSVALLLVLTCATAVFESGSKAAKPASDVPVTTTIDGLGVDTLPTLRLQSDQLGAYRTTKSGKTVSLQSIIQGIGDWEMDMLNFTSSPQRKVLIDLREPVPGSGPNGTAPINPFGATGYQLVRARFIVKCTENGINFLTMQTNTPYLCPLALRFNEASGVGYRLVQNPANFSQSNWVQVACVATTDGKCSQWRIEPNVVQPDGERKNLAKLLKLASSQQETEQDYGDFYVSFTIHLSNP